MAEKNEKSPSKWQTFLQKVRKWMENRGIARAKRTKTALQCRAELEAVFKQYEQRLSRIPCKAAAGLGAEIGLEVGMWRSRYALLGEPVLSAIYDEVTNAVVRGDDREPAQGKPEKEGTICRK